MVRSPRSSPRGEADLDRHQHCRALVTAAWLTRQALGEPCTTTTLITGGDLTITILWDV